MNVRKIPLVNGQYYHIFSRSIAKYEVFNDADDFERVFELIDLCRYTEFDYKYSRFKELEISTRGTIINKLRKENNTLTEIIAFCIMPTHLHLLLKQVANKGISKYISKILNSYTKYFNSRHHRNGPLWESHFKNVLVNNDEQLLHLTRYIHLNPSSTGLVSNPFDWQLSSLKEYCEEITNGICQFNEIIDMSTRKYKKFVLDQKNYQRSLSLIKSIMIDNYAG